MLVLGIETTCDETAVAIVEDGKKILIQLVNSQIHFHQKFAGVFPEYASRRHLEALLPLVEQVLKKTGLSPSSIDLIAVAHGPGLIGALVMGLNAAKALALAWNKPFVGVNHIEAHLYAATIDQNVLFPALGVVISGGHTALLLLQNSGTYQLIGTTVDDAIGEAFDKVASILNLPYPGGPEIEKIAREGDPSRYPFKAGNVKSHPFDFSFSGLKTNVLYTAKGEKSLPLKIPKEDIKHIAASFQHVALSDIVNKAFLAAKKYQARSILFGGGVSQNQYLRMLAKARCEEIFYLHWPPRELCLDNGAMIAGLGYHQFKMRGSDNFDLTAKPRIPFSAWNKIAFHA